MNKPLLIGVAGGSGSGKTFFLNCLKAHFAEGEISLISQDDYYRPKSQQPVDANGWINFDLPQCIDDSALLKDLRKLMSGQTVEKKEYTFNVDEENARTLRITPAPIVLIEGLFIFHFPKIASLLDMRIFLDAEEEITLNRRLQRDIAERGYSHDMIMYQWINHALPAYKTYLLPYKDSADRIILNNGHVADDIAELSKAVSDELKRQVFKLS